MPAGGPETAVERHTCGGPVFGRRTPGCPRCDQLEAGAAPIAQPWRGRRVQADAQLSREIHAHFAPGSEHARGLCGPVCTFGDW